ncbi:protein Smaug homolog 2-like [Athene noctua]|uniref:protein Smaug homolog 2-like n=1 Tax=Athene noctua TaxID=126797 RepID=UPI003EBEDBB3
MEPSCPDAARGPPPPLEGPEDAATESGPSRSAAAPEENRHPPLYPPTSSSGPGGAALPSQLHPSPLEPSLSLVPGRVQGGRSGWVWGGNETPVPVPPCPPFGAHAPLLPQSSVASWGSEQTEEPAGGRNTFEEEGSGMKDVPSWLESLGLQEYTALFSQMTYEEMMRLTEHHLELQNVPWDTRQKILLSIQKLWDRLSTLRALAKDIERSRNVWLVLHELKQIIVTPIKAFWRSPAARPANSSSKGAPQGPPHAKAGEAPAIDGDIPGLFTRVMGRVCTPLLNSWMDEENITSYLQLLEKCLSHEAFTETQKKKLCFCKRQVLKLLGALPQKVPLYGPGDQPPQRSPPTWGLLGRPPTPGPPSAAPHRHPGTSEPVFQQWGGRGLPGEPQCGAAEPLAARPHLGPGPARLAPGVSPPRHGPGDQPHA